MSGMGLGGNMGGNMGGGIGGGVGGIGAIGIAGKNSPIGMDITSPAGMSSGGSLAGERYSLTDAESQELADRYRVPVAVVTSLLQEKGDIQQVLAELEVLSGASGGAKKRCREVFSFFFFSFCSVFIISHSLSSSLYTDLFSATDSGEKCLFICFYFLEVREV